MTDRSSDPTAHDLPTTAELGDQRMTPHTLERYAAWQESEAIRLVARAHEAIAEAREELNRIEAELAMALEGEPYRRLGRIDGLNAQVIFDAFGTIERAGQLRAALELEAEKVARG